MHRLIAAGRRYWAVTLTLVVGTVGGVLALVGLGVVMPWLFGGYALLIAGWQAIGMVRAILRRQLGLDLLAVTAIVAAVAVGEFVAALIVVLMLSGGEALEDFANRRAQRELDALLERSPQHAHRIDDGVIHEIAAAEVRIDDLLLIRPAEIVPVDGVLVSAAGAFDESSLTGEPIPVEKVAGDRVLSGSVNGSAALELRAVATADTSQYQQIVALVKQAAASRAPVVRLADRYALPFTALALALAGIAWAVSGEPVRFAEVLVLATPCPLLIAAPVAFLGGMSRAARAGIIVKGGGVLEQLARARTAVFDKTGTLTHGTPELVTTRVEAGFTPDELLGLVASAEQYSSHVLAAAFVAAASTAGLELGGVEEAHEQATNGVVARIGGREVVVGKFGYVAERAPDAVRTAIGPGEIAVYVAVDGVFAGALLARDTVRPEAAETLRRLRANGIADLRMLTGDAQQSADHIAAEVGIATVRADCLPADKVAEIAGITRRPVVMVGDGVNDAPVLAAAEVGLAMGARGSTAASESAGAVILVDDLSRVADAVAIGKDTVRIALQSIWLGIAVSVALMVVAMFGVIPATLGAVLQEGIDLVAILAALRAARDRVE